MNRSEFPDKIDHRWTLFLDRDGVLNERIVDDYVRKWEDWVWNPGVLEAIAHLSKRFGRIFIVTNQRGIARGLYSEADLKAIHDQMIAEINQAGGRIDGIFYCPHDKDAGCDCRKPKPGMLKQAAKAHPAVDFKYSLLVGDSISDLEAAKNAGNMPAVYIGKVRLDLPDNVLTALPDLATFARLFD
jgi:D-glycero-D-manno-heptose 1,7-bisphosphate phosphatase